MKLAFVVEQFHDYEPHSKFVDLDLLDKKNPVDRAILKELKEDKDWEIGVWYDGRDCDHDAPGISPEAIIDEPRLPLEVHRVIF